MYCQRWRIGRGPPYQPGTVPQPVGDGGQHRELCMAGALCEIERRTIYENNHSQQKSNTELFIMKPKQTKLDKEEQELLRDFEDGNFKRAPRAKAEKAALEEAAKNTLQKDKRINIRISSRDLERLQRQAAREGIPYQTYISSSLHKLVTGRLKETA